MQAKTTATSDTPRERLIEGLAHAVSTHGYAAATIAGIVRHAKVSKRTFYEHFADKEECFLAAFADASTQVLNEIASAVDPDAPWATQIRAAVRAYLMGLESRPALARAFLLEIQAAGPHALKARRSVQHQFAAQLRGFVEEARRRDKSIPPLSPEMATALVGGLNELVLLTVETGRRRLTALAETAEQFALAVLT